MSLFASGPYPEGIKFTVKRAKVSRKVSHLSNCNKSQSNYIQSHVIHCQKCCCIVFFFWTKGTKLSIAALANKVDNKIMFQMEFINVEPIDNLQSFKTNWIYINKIKT